MIAITDEMVEAAKQAIRYLDHPETPWSEEQVRAILTAALATVPGEIGVKALEWREITSPREDGPAEPTGDWEAYTLIGEYSVNIDTDDDVKDYPWCAWSVESRGHFASLDEAKAAAQADFAQRIRSALQPQPSAPAVRMAEPEPGMGIGFDPRTNEPYPVYAGPSAPAGGEVAEIVHKLLDMHAHFLGVQQGLGILDPVGMSDEIETLLKAAAALDRASKALAKARSGEEADAAEQYRVVMKEGGE